MISHENRPSFAHSQTYFTIIIKNCQNAFEKPSKKIT